MIMMTLFTCFPAQKPRRDRSVSAMKPNDECDHDGHGCSRESSSIMEDSRFILRRFSWSEMETLMANLSPSRVIGQGGFSTVYLANLPGTATAAAVKVYRGSSELLSRMYKQELEILRRLEHENIVKLLGFSDDDDDHEEVVLALEYMPNGTLREKLHEAKDSAALSWESRMSIVFCLARAIRYLHEECPLQIVHGDIKASNVLLDEELNCKLCDFGSAKMGFSSAVMPPGKRVMLCSPGYTDPHYLRTGLASAKNDVYSFGVILLEVITGVEAFSARDGEMLTAKAGPALREEMIDSRLCRDGSFVMEEAMAMASLSRRCLSDTPSLRPTMSQVLEIMRDSVGSIPSLSSEREVGGSMSRYGQNQVLSH